MTERQADELCDQSAMDQGGQNDRVERAVMRILMQEWRTPPLWGFRDSGPYLHDGRAKNLEEAVAFHDGQAANSATKKGSGAKTVFWLLTPFSKPDCSIAYWPHGRP
jgi:cytochrome c peroxidase